jgi:hypothetical protein
MNNQFTCQCIHIINNLTSLTQSTCIIFHIFLLIGNLNKNITEEQLRGSIDGIIFIKWITDRQTREFYGTTYIEVKNPKCAINAVKMDKQKLMGRPLKIYYCPPKPGDVWPPPHLAGRGEGGYPNPNERNQNDDHNGASNSNNNSKTGNILMNEDGSKRPNPFSKQTPKPPNGKKLYIGKYRVCDFLVLYYYYYYYYYYYNYYYIIPKYCLIILYYTIQYRKFILFN